MSNVIIKRPKEIFELFSSLGNLSGVGEKKLDEYFKKRVEYRKKLKTGMREILLKDGTVMLANETRLKDGSLLSIYSDITEFKKESYQNSLGYVDQNPFLFNDTIINNIRWGSKKKISNKKISKN